jgi:hypothetical protein
MHSKDGRKTTIDPIKPVPAGVIIGQRDGLSRTDYYELNTLYGCQSG